MWENLDLLGKIVLFRNMNVFKKMVNTIRCCFLIIY